MELPIDLSLAPKVSLLVLDKNNPLRGDALLAWAEFDVRDFMARSFCYDYMTIHSDPGNRTTSLLSLLKNS